MQKRTLGLISAAAISTLFGTSIAANGDAYTWPSYTSLDYSTKEHFGTIAAPTQFNTDCSGVTGKKAGKWWAFYWGANRDSRITDVTVDSILKKYDTDFMYLYDTMGWSPDAQARDGKYSAVYYYGSGTCAGGATTDTTGGWQTYVAGYTAVAASFYPLYSFNTSCPYSDRVSQMDAMIHEGIHSMTKGYPGASNAHWFQEAGNTWIQQDMASHRNTVYSGMGFLNASTLMAPFMPIETYSGWLIDGTFGGPGGGEDNGGVTGKNQRSLLGGAQYSNIFPTFLGTWLGTGTVRWIYGNAYGSTKYLLETYALDKGLGAAATRRLITEFRAKLCLLDMKEWSSELRTLINNNFNQQTYWEQGYWDNGTLSYTWNMTPYQTMTQSGEYLVPDEATTPGWSGANFIPLKVQSGASQVTVSFYKQGNYSTDQNMNYLLCYRATDGTPVYSEPITGDGSVTLRLDKTPSSTNGTQMVFAVVVNTDYQYTNNTSIRTYHYNYKIKLEEGLSGAGSASTAYHKDFTLKYDWNSIQATSSSSTNSSSSTIASSSSSSNTGVATLTKCGGGSSNQSVEAGSAITEFCYTWENATSVEYSGFPTGVTATIDNSSKKITISGTVGASVAAAKYSFTVTTTGAVTNASKSGSITVTNSAQSSSSVSSSSVTPASSSSSVVASSSSIASSSSVVPASSSSTPVIAGTTVTKNVSVNLPIDDNYATVSFTYDLAEIAAALGISASNLSSVQFFAEEANGNKVTTTNTDGLGHWFDQNGNVIAWGDSAKVFCDFDLTNAKGSVGHYPNHVSAGDTYVIKQGFTNNGNTVLFVITVTIVNDSSSEEAEGTLAMMYGLNGPATHMNVSVNKGVLSVKYNLDNRDNVKISLFTGYGAMVDMKMTGYQGKGAHIATFNMKDMPKGTYIVKVTTGSYREAKSVTINR